MEEEEAWFLARSEQLRVSNLHTSEVTSIEHTWVMELAEDLRSQGSRGAAGTVSAASALLPFDAPPGPPSAYVANDGWHLSCEVGWEVGNVEVDWTTALDEDVFVEEVFAPATALASLADGHAPSSMAFSKAWEPGALVAAWEPGALVTDIFQQATAPMPFGTDVYPSLPPVHYTQMVGVTHMHTQRHDTHTIPSSAQASAIDIFQGAKVLTPMPFGQDINPSVHYAQPTTIDTAGRVAAAEMSAHRRELSQDAPPAKRRTHATIQSDGFRVAAQASEQRLVSPFAYLDSSSPIASLLMAGSEGISNPRSCDHCRKRKIKCTRQRPCSHCVSRGLSSSCNAGSDESRPAMPIACSSQETTALYRPISTCREFEFALKDHVSLAKVALSCKLHPVLMHRLADVSIFPHFPPNLCIYVWCFPCISARVSSLLCGSRAWYIIHIQMRLVLCGGGPPTPPRATWTTSACREFL